MIVDRSSNMVVSSDQLAVDKFLKIDSIVVSCVYLALEGET